MDLSPGGRTVPRTYGVGCTITVCGEPMAELQPGAAEGLYMLHSKMRCFASRIRVGAIAVILASAVTTVSAQRELTFFVSATTITGEIVTDLKAEEVRITEDGKE